MSKKTLKTILVDLSCEKVNMFYCHVNVETSVLTLIKNDYIPVLR